jgi:hypothetical protein
MCARNSTMKCVGRGHNIRGVTPIIIVVLFFNHELITNENQSGLNHQSLPQKKSNPRRNGASFIIFFFIV